MDVEHWLLSLPVARLSQYRLEGCLRGVGRVGSVRRVGWTRCWVLRERALGPGCLWIAGPDAVSPGGGVVLVGPVVF